MKDLIQHIESLTAERPLGETEPLLTRSDIIRATLQHGRAAVEAELFPRVVAFWRAYVTQHGWFYPQTQETLSDALADVAQVEPAGAEVSSRVTAGSTFLQARFRSFWNVDGGPVKGFDKGIEAVVAYRMGLNNSKDYSYKLDDGSTVTSRETFDITIANIRRGFVVQRRSVSFFKPSAAAALFKRWCPSREPVVWDPSAGFGARLLGLAAAFPLATYYANEPAKAIADDVEALAHDLIEAGRICKVRINRLGSELVGPPVPVDLVLTSPPYFDLERYYDEIGQCWKEYPTQTAWETRYLQPTLKLAVGSLTPGGHVVLNVNAKQQDALIRAAELAGLRQVGAHRLTLGSDHFMRKTAKPTENRSEPICVFAKR